MLCVSAGLRPTKRWVGGVKPGSTPIRVADPIGHIECVEGHLEEEQGRGGAGAASVAGSGPSSTCTLLREFDDFRFT